MALVVTLPWTKLRWALPFFSVLATPPAVSEALGQRHKTIARIAQQMVLIVHSFLPEVSIKVIGDSAYSVIELGLTCLKQRVSLIAPLRLRQVKPSSIRSEEHTSELQSQSNLVCR